APPPRRLRKGAGGVPNRSKKTPPRPPPRQGSVRFLQPVLGLAEPGLRYRGVADQELESFLHAALAAAAAAAVPAPQHLTDPRGAVPHGPQVRQVQRHRRHAAGEEVLLRPRRLAAAGRVRGPPGELAGDGPPRVGVPARDEDAPPGERQLLGHLPPQPARPAGDEAGPLRGSGGRGDHGRGVSRGRGGFWCGVRGGGETPVGARTPRGVARCVAAGGAARTIPRKSEVDGTALTGEEGKPDGKLTEKDDGLGLPLLFSARRGATPPFPSLFRLPGIHARSLGASR
ncbi:MAG: hypothetical protein BJ554DRAFT_8219, partial [Olpidium bornovanus]